VTKLAEHKKMILLDYSKESQKGTVFMITDEACVCVHTSGIFVTAKSNIDNIKEYKKILLSDSSRVRSHFGYSEIDDVVRTILNTK